MRVKNFSLGFGLQLFKAFSEEARIRILHLLYQETEMCITDLEHVLDFTQTKTSRHISYLRNAGLVYSRQVDQFMYYRIRHQAKDVVEQLFLYMSKDAVLLKDHETYKILYSNRELAINKLQQKKWRNAN
ncbi:MAG: ArsR/SmtB family transcription factor [Cyclobacteriaceae bacterium]